MNAIFLAAAIVFLVLGLVLRMRGKTIHSMRMTGTFFFSIGVFGVIYFIVNFPMAQLAQMLRRLD